MDLCALQLDQVKILCKIRFFLTPKIRLLIHYIGEYMKSIPICLYLRMTSLGHVTKFIGISGNYRERKT